MVRLALTVLLSPYLTYHDWQKPGPVPTVLLTLGLALMMRGIPNEHTKSDRDRCVKTPTGRAKATRGLCVSHCPSIAESNPKTLSLQEVRSTAMGKCWMVNRLSEA